MGIISGRLHDAVTTAQLSAKAAIAPKHTYTYDSNPEIVISAVDVDTETFTSEGHGLVSNDKIFAVTNGGAVFPLAVFAGGLTHIQYYVIYVDEDHFQISDASGPGAALNITTNASIDLTKWHFEKNLVTSVDLTSMSISDRARIVIKGIIPIHGGFVSIRPNSLYGNCLASNTTTYGNAIFFGDGSVQFVVDALLTLNDVVSLMILSHFAKSNTTSAVANTEINRRFTWLNETTQTLASLRVTFSTGIANGLLVEVYDS